MEIFAGLVGMALSGASIVVPVALVVGLIVGMRWHTRGQREAVARALGLQFDGRRMTGTLEGVEARVWTEERGGKNKVTWTLAHFALSGLPPDATVVARRLGTTVRRDLYVGDTLFDERYAIDVHGGGWAWLSEGRRAALFEVNANLANGSMTVEVRGKPDADRIREWARTAARVEVHEPAEVLDDMASTDPSPFVRARAQAVLFQSGAPVDPARLDEWAAAPGLAGAVARVWRDGQTPWTTAEHGELYTMADILVEIGPGSAVVGLLDAVNEQTPRPAWHRLTDAAARFLDPDLAGALVRAAGRRGDEPFTADRALHALLGQATPSLEDEVLAVLPRGERSVVDAARWLGLNGTIAAVPTLDTIASDAWPLSEARAAAAEAKRLIHGRMRGSRGALALADDVGAGQVSVADDRAAGAVSEARRRDAD